MTENEEHSYVLHMLTGATGYNMQEENKKRGACGFLKTSLRCLKIVLSDFFGFVRSFSSAALSYVKIFFFEPSLCDIRILIGGISLVFSICILGLSAAFSVAGLIVVAKIFFGLFLLIMFCGVVVLIIQLTNYIFIVLFSTMGKAVSYFGDVRKRAAEEEEDEKED